MSAFNSAKEAFNHLREDSPLRRLSEEEQKLLCGLLTLVVGTRKSGPSIGGFERLEELLRLTTATAKLVKEMDEQGELVWAQSPQRLLLFSAGQLQPLL